MYCATAGLLLLAMTGIAATSAAILPHHTTSARELQDSRPCNSQIANISIEEIQAFNDLYFRATLEPAGLGDAIDLANDLLVANSLQYNLTVHKVCGSCDAVRTYYTGAGIIDGVDDVCGPGVHGFDATHSALVFVPAMEDGAVLPQGKLPSFVGMHSFRTSLADGPTAFWPVSLLQTVQDAVVSNDALTFLTLFQDYFPGLVIASSGVAAIYPDYIGYGASNTFDRSNMQQTYAQAAVTSYVATGEYLSVHSGACTLLDTTGTMYGSSEGGFAVIPAAEALSSFVDIKAVDSAAGPLNTLVQMAFLTSSIESLEVSFDKNNLVFQVIAPFLGFIHSRDLPGLANTGSYQQRFVSETFQNASSIETDVFQWFEGPNALSFLEVLALSPPNALDTLNPNLVDLLRSLGSFASEDLLTCPPELIVEGTNDLLCKTMEQNNLWETIANTNLPLQLCFSADDTVTTVDNFPSFLYENNPSVRLFTPPIPELTPSGDHLQAQILCNNAALLSFQANPLAIQPLSLQQQAICDNKQEDSADGVNINQEEDDLKQLLQDNIYVLAGAGVGLIVVITVCLCFCRRKN